MLISSIVDRIKFLTSKDKELYSSLYHIIGFYPHNISVYKLALMHKSTKHRNDNGKPVNNERLEFLGDAILDATVGDIVYRHFPGKREGFLTNTRSKLVQRETLNKLAEELGVNRLIMSSGRNCSHNSYMGGNAFEALVGAIYLDKGYNTCMRFIEKRILTDNLDINKVAYKEKNFKSKLIEWCQKNKVEMRFELLEQTIDEDGNPMFNSAVYIENIKSSENNGFSKKESHQRAAKLTLDRLKTDPKFIDEVFAAKAERTRVDEQIAEQEDASITQVSMPEAKSEVTAEPDKSENEAVIYTDIPVYEPDVNATFGLDDIRIKTENDMTQEEIIAAAEEAAFKE